ncbi:MAG: twin-arginine translocase TatA/TatE family subunit [Flavobacteriaceae bacterium]|nr:MAG: twin-arginine translocase TatA/TatE family subunit [Flavobacteriaceae bacterium]
MISTINTYLAFFDQQLIWVALIAILLFGGSKIPELMKGVGKGISEFKKATKDEELDADKQKDNHNS